MAMRPAPHLCPQPEESSPESTKGQATEGPLLRKCRPGENAPAPHTGPPHRSGWLWLVPRASELPARPGDGPERTGRGRSGPTSTGTNVSRKASQNHAQNKGWSCCVGDGHETPPSRNKGVVEVPVCGRWILLGQHPILAPDPARTHFSLADAPTGHTCSILNPTTGNRSRQLLPGPPARPCPFSLRYKVWLVWKERSHLTSLPTVLDTGVLAASVPQGRLNLCLFRNQPSDPSKEDAKER